jgi:hypothetical protein
MTFWLSRASENQYLTAFNLTLISMPNFNVVNPLTHGGGPIGPPLFQRPVAQKVMKLKKFGKINYSMEIVLVLKLSSGVSSTKVVLYK